MTHSSYYCWVTNQPKHSGINNNHLIVFMDSVYQKSGRAQWGCLVSVPGCLEPQLERAQSLRVTWRVEAGIIWKLVHSYVWRLMLAVSWDLGWGSVVPDVSPSSCLGFFTARWLGCKASILKARGRNPWHLYKLASEVISCHFSCALLVEKVTKDHLGSWIVHLLGRVGLAGLAQVVCTALSLESKWRLLSGNLMRLTGSQMVDICCNSWSSVLVLGQSDSDPFLPVPPLCVGEADSCRLHSSCSLIEEFWHICTARVSGQKLQGSSRGGEGELQPQ